MTEFEITQAMIDAGEKVFRDNDYGDADYTLDVSAIYQAMRMADETNLVSVAEIVEYDGPLAAVFGTRDIKLNANISELPVGTVLYARLLESKKGRL